MIKKPPFQRIITRCRNFKDIKEDQFVHDISNSSLVTSPSDNLVGLVQQYESVLTSILNTHAPSKERIITLRPSAPWYSSDIRAEKIKRRKLERSWRRSRLTVDRELYVHQCGVVKRLIKNSKNDLFANLITEQQSNQKVLCSTFEKMIHKNADNLFPSAFSPGQLVNSFADFFVNKISTIQTNFNDNTCDLDFQPVTLDSYLTSFYDISPENLSKLLSTLVAKSCDLDPVLAKS
jgi:hypothetical protein